MQQIYLKHQKVMSCVNDSSTERPEAVEIKEQHRGWEVYIHVNIEEHTSEDMSTYYTFNTATLILGKDELTPELRADMEANPAKYVSYIPVAERPALQKQYTDAIQKWMDDTAHTRGYDDIFTAISYESSLVNRFREEANACRMWRDVVWVTCYDYLDKVLAGEEELIPVEELIKKLPQIEW